MLTSSRKCMRLTCFLLVCCLILSVSGCSSGTTPPGSTSEAESEPKTGGTVTLAVADEPDTLDVSKVALIASATVTTLLGEPLLYFDQKTKEMKPHLAESYSISEDGKTWTFTLRSGVTFHDGTPLTAMSFKQTLERAMDPQTASPLAGPYLSSVKSVSAPDERTLLLELKEPSAPLLTRLSDASIMQPLSMAAVEKFGKEYARNPVGVGAWKFESWKTGESITLVRNEAYQWPDPDAKNRGAARIDKIVIKYITDNNTRLAALESGSIDMATNVLPKDIQKFKNSEKFTILEKMSPGITFIEMNTASEILKDLNVRKALNMAINKEAIIKSALQGEALIAHSPLPQSVPGYDPAVEQYAYKYNAEEAAKQLDAAGWKQNAQGIRAKGGQTLSLKLLSVTKTAQENQLIQSMLKEIGVDVKIDVVDIGTLLQMASKGEYDMALLYYVDSDPSILNSLMHSSQIGGLNHSRINNKQLDSLLEKGITTIDQSERQKVYEEIQKIVVDQAYWVPLYTVKEFTLVNKRVQGVKLQPLAGYNFQDAWVKQ